MNSNLNLIKAITYVKYGSNTFAQLLHLIICIFVVMKLIAFILSIYMLALNFMPCEDDHCADEDTVCIETTEIHDTEHSHADLCSPFCECQCCHMHVTYTTLANTLIVAPEISTEVFSHFDSLGNDFTTTLLQPPRV